MQDCIGLGLIGNFADHLEQAGELADLKVLNVGNCAPVGLFPFYVANSNTFLGRYCIDADKIVLPTDESMVVQAEAEVCIEFDLEYSNGLVSRAVPRFFRAFNDATIRHYPGSVKMSERKNFSHSSKGIGDVKFEIGKFSSGGVCDNYSLSSFLISGGSIHQYGETAKVVDYSYFYEKLLDFIVDRLNFQEDHSVLDCLLDCIKSCNYPSKALIAIGATRYTSFGEKRFLRVGDEICIVLYDHTKLNVDDVKRELELGSSHIDSASVIRQAVFRSS